VVIVRKTTSMNWPLPPYSQAFERDLQKAFPNELALL
jgi:hypothetical protein